MSRQNNVKDIEDLSPEQIEAGDRREAAKMDATNTAFIKALLRSRYGPMVVACQKSNAARASWRQA